MLKISLIYFVTTHADYQWFILKWLKLRKHKRRLYFFSQAWPPLLQRYNMLFVFHLFTLKLIHESLFTFFVRKCRSLSKCSGWGRHLHCSTLPVATHEKKNQQPEDSISKEKIWPPTLKKGHQRSRIIFFSKDFQAWIAHTQYSRILSTMNAWNRMILP